MSEVRHAGICILTNMKRPIILPLILLMLGCTAFAQAASLEHIRTSLNYVRAKTYVFATAEEIGAQELPSATCNQEVEDGYAGCYFSPVTGLAFIDAWTQATALSPYRIAELRRWQRDDDGGYSMMYLVEGHYAIVGVSESGFLFIRVYLD